MTTNTGGKRPPRRLSHYLERTEELRQIADLRSTDRVLDVGCAEGLIALEVAGSVGHVHGIDTSRSRIAAAIRDAAERQIPNATFEVASVVDYELEPETWDVSLFMCVWGKAVTGDDSRTIGAAELGRLLRATRRQVVIRTGVQHERRAEPKLEEILALCDRHSFDALCFSQTAEDEVAVNANTIIANRRGSGARTGRLPVLALMPTSMLTDHPVVRSSASSTEDVA
jgi:SAM-dependent methyltransferase